MDGGVGEGALVLEGEDVLAAQVGEDFLEGLEGLYADVLDAGRGEGAAADAEDGGDQASGASGQGVGQRLELAAGQEGAEHENDDQDRDG